MYHRRHLLNLWIPILAAFLIAACSAQPTPTPAPTSSADEWQATILNALRAQNENSWRYESDTKTADGGGGQTTVEYVPPDRYHIYNLPHMDMIIIGEQVYARQGEKWSRVEVPAGSIIDPEGTSRLEKSIHDVQCTSPETVDGKPMHACQYASLTKIGDGEETIQTRLWIDIAMNLPYKMIIDGAVGSMDSETRVVSPVKATSTLLYTFDPALQITPPELSE